MKKFVLITTPSYYSYSGIPTYSINAESINDVFKMINGLRLEGKRFIEANYTMQIMAGLDAYKTKIIQNTCFINIETIISIIEVDQNDSTFKFLYEGE